MQSSTWLPSINAARCTGCHKCVDACPTGALAQVAGKAALVYPDLCTYCSVCEDLCPVQAISLPFLIVRLHSDSHSAAGTHHP